MATRLFAWRLGMVLTGVIAILQGLNFWRSWADPIGFSAYMGLPTTEPGFVQIYGLPAGFIALLLAGLLLIGARRAMLVCAVAALLMPLGDLWLTYQRDADVATLLRHGAIAVYVALTAILLWRGRTARERQA